MKNLMKVLAIIITLNVGSGLTGNKAHAQEGDVSFQAFYDGMSPYGNWVDYPGAGYVWVPNVDAGFTPYGTNGHWVMTDYGWTWVSDYPWGWAPFHYGRWDYDNSYGWVWAPDNVWGPAWVSWRNNDGYYGWSPMRPGVSVEVSFGRDYHEDDNRWTFVNRRDFDRDDVSSHYENRSNNRTIIQNTTIINNTYIDNSRHNTYVSGPKREDVQRSTGRPVQSVKVRDDNKPGQKVSNGELAIYRPQVQRTTAKETKPAPRAIVAARDVKPIGKREYVNQQKPVTQNNVSEKKSEPVQQTPNKARNEVQKPNTPVTPQVKKDIPVQQTPNNTKNEMQKTNTPVTPQVKRVEPVQQTPAKDKVVEQKKEVVAPVQQQKAVPVKQTTRQEYIDKARQGNRPTQPANRVAPTRPNSPKQNNTPSPSQQPIKQNTPQPEPKK